MKHFSEASWADFVRNQVSADQRMTMQQHIDDGCKLCRGTLQFWQGVFSIAGKESSFTPPANAVRVVKSQFGTMFPQASSGVRLVFDSMLQPITAGLRGSVAARQLLYETDDYYIDLRLEPRSTEDRAGLVGQILNRKGEDRAAQGVAVQLQEGKLTIAQTSTNRFGEFQLEFSASTGLCISIGRNRRNDILLPLYGIQVKPVEPEDLD
ncbi:MAG TPA: hypothetical protein VEF05_13335 [Terriglobales bacterium]|nr:hypothetical protein [Terriglobales bacterium]